MNILQTMGEEKLFKKIFAPKRKLFGRANDSWATWRVFLSALFGLGLDAEQLAVYRKHTEREDIPAKQFREAYLVCGRRSGKSIIASLIAVYLACFRDYSGLAPGETAVVMILAADRKQARTIFNYVVALLEAPLLRSMVVTKRKESVDLNNNIRIEVHTSNYRSVRGTTIAAAICDELSFWQSEDSANPDQAVVDALIPAMVTIPGALLLGISSPYGKRGVLWNEYKENFGKHNETLVWQSDSLSMNPTLPESVIQSAYRKDPSSARAEFGGQFRDDVQGFISVEMVEANVVAGRKELPYDASKRYYGFTDPSGGASDSFTMAIAHREKDKAVLDLVREARAPLSPKMVAAEFAGIFKTYHISEIEGDRYGGSWPGEEFGKYGINYKPTDKSKSDLYLELLPGLMGRTLELLDNSKLVSQLTSLERKTGKLHDSVDHPQNAHDDVANSCAGVLVRVLADNVTGQLGLLDYYKELATGSRKMPASVEERLTTRVDNLAVQRAAEKYPTCPSCKEAGLVRPAPVLGGYRCRQCGRSMDAEGHITCEFEQTIVGATCCGDAAAIFQETGRLYAQKVSGELRCVACGKQSGHRPEDPEPRGITRKDYAARRWAIGQFAIKAPRNNKNTYGRFG
jgi:hypothetical protein